LPSSDSEVEPEDSAKRRKSEQRREDTMILMLENSMNFLGIHKSNLGVIDILANKLKVPTAKADVLLALRKVRKNECYTDLSIYFGWSPKTISKKIKATLPVLSSCFEQLIFRPDAARIKLNLPQAFRHKYHKTSEIIDCYEVEIQKPGNAKHQNLTFSSYKHANTLKTLISITPDGMVCWVSKAFCGRISDVAICNESGYISSLTGGMHVMADRGFKHLDAAMRAKGVKLVRPPSVAKGQVLSRSVNSESKQIAALRIHVERLIQRVRGFAVLKPHCVLNLEFVPLYDYCTVIACGLVNLMTPLIKV
jgi:DDE superfamily endonuclease